MAQEAGDDHGAARLTDMAAGLASAAADWSMADYARVRKALIALYRGDAGQTVALAGAARGAADSRVRRLAAFREAQGHALAGDERECMAALDAARELEAGPRGTGESARYGSSAVPDMTELVAGWCLYDLGRLEDADAEFREGLARIPPDALRARARFATRHALVQASMRELDQACDTMARAVPCIARADSATIRTDLCAFSRQIGRWRTNRAAHELRPTITAILLKSPPRAVAR